MPPTPTKFCNVCRYFGEDVTVDNSKLDGLDVQCPRCGRYYVTASAIEILGNPSRSDGPSDLDRAALGCWLRQQQVAGQYPKLDSYAVDRLIRDSLFPSLHDQRESLLSYLGRKSNGPGDRVDISSSLQQFEIGASTPNAIGMLLSQLEREGLAECPETRSHHGARSFAVYLTFNGWLACEDIKRGKSTGRRAFMAMPFNRPDLDDLWLPTLREAVEKTGFRLERVDDQPRPGLIDDQMRLQIRQARFLIVELTHANNGAYWEAGFAEGLGKPVIYSCREDQKAHFDVDHSLRIEWTESTMDKAAKKLKAVIRNAMPDAIQIDKEPGSGT